MSLLVWDDSAHDRQESDPRKESHRKRPVLCASCRKINLGSFLRQGPIDNDPTVIPSPRFWEQPLASMKEKARSCNMCRGILEAISDLEGLFPKDEELIVSLIVVDITNTASGQHHALSTQVRAKKPVLSGYTLLPWAVQGPNLVVDLTGNESIPGEFGVGGRLVPRKLNIPMVLEWLQSCQQLHPHSCAQKELPTPFRKSLRLIDVSQQCIVQAPEGCRYVALSYVWGETVDLRLTVSNCGYLSQKRAFFAIRHRIPDTIKDAMTLCSQIGERYLWVDSLCIMHDDEEDRSKQIMHMGSIYASAFLTIVAAAGDHAYSPLPGILGDRPPKPAQTQFSADDIDLISTNHSLVDSLKATTWSSRGWTLQEQVLSQRLLVILKTQALFFCRKAIWREDMRSSTEGTPIPWSHQANTLVARSDLFLDSGSPPEDRLRTSYKTYTRLCQDMLRRCFTYRADVLNAFAGIEEFLRPTLGEFVFGHPSVGFLASLLWYPDRGDAWDRRVETFMSRDSRVGFPSWSWCGWFSTKQHLLHQEVQAEELRGPRIFRFSSQNDLNQLREIRWFSDTSFVLDDGAADLACAALPPELRRAKNLLKGSWASIATLLVFHTQVAVEDVVLLEIGRCAMTDPHSLFRDFESGPQVLRRGRYEIRGQRGLSVGQVLLTSRTGSAKLGLIEVCRDGENVYAMLVQMIGPIAYRIALVDGPIRLRKWKELNTASSLVILG